MASRRARVLAEHLPPPRSPAGGRPCSAGAEAPLAGVRVLDLSQMLSGPMGCQILADQGADVVKVEPLGGDSVRAMSEGMSAGFTVINRNKRSIAVDLRRPEGRAAVLRLARTADVVVQNFRPGAVERLGVGYDDVRKVRPDIVYLSISGFGESGPYVGKRTYDPVIQAVTGLASVQVDEAGRPRMMGLIVPDKVSALTAAQAVTAALLRRARTGAGQHVRLAMQDAVTAFMWADAMSRHTLIRGPEDAAKADASEQSNRVHDMIYECKDGYITCGTITMKEWRALCAALDRPGWLKDPRFQTAAGLGANRAARLEMVQARLRTMTCADALRRLGDDVPCAPVYHPRSRALADPQLRHNRTIVDAVHPVAGPLRFPRPAARFDVPFALRHHAPLIGEHTDEILRGAGVSATEIRELREAGVLRKEAGVH